MAERDFRAIYAKRKAAGDPNVMYRNRPGTTLAVTAEIHDRLKGAADERGVSVVWLARRLLTEGLDSLKPATELVLTRKLPQISDES